MRVVDMTANEGTFCSTHRGNCLEQVFSHPADAQNDRGVGRQTSPTLQVHWQGTDAPTRPVFDRLSGVDVRHNTPRANSALLPQCRLIWPATEHSHGRYATPLASFPANHLALQLIATSSNNPLADTAGISPMTTWVFLSVDPCGETK